MSRGQSCANCAYAAFTLTPSGRIKALVAGRCGAQLPDLASLPTIPACVFIPPLSKSGIWPDMGMDCRVWKAKQPQKVPT